MRYRQESRLSRQQVARQLTDASGQTYTERDIARMEMGIDDPDTLIWFWEQ